MMYLKTLLRLLIRILIQKPVKTLRTIRSKERLLGTIWLESNKKNISHLIKFIGKDENLLNEAKEFEKNFLIKKKDIIKNLPITGGLKGYSGGGGGNIFVLYYIVRYFKPSVVIESGVSAGNSSSTIIQALEKNNNGNLYSSDLATHLKKKDIGILIPNYLKYRWKLFEKGDKANLPEILDQVKNIDIVYYDSEKSYQGKKIFMETIFKKFNPEIIIIDDIDRDYWFRDFVKTKYKKYEYLVVKNVGYLFKIN